jgi:quercetin dioxygenase-like cupin family protein
VLVAGAEPPHLVEGAIEVEVDDQSISFGLGDAISFAGDVTHSNADPRKRPAMFFLDVFEPGAGPRHHPDVDRA